MASVFKTKEGMWRAQIRRTGQATKTRNFPTKQEAQTWARAVEHDADQAGGVPQALKISFERVVDRYNELSDVRRQGDTKRSCLKRLRAYFGPYRLGEITQEAIVNFALRRQREGAGPSTVAQDLVYFKTAMRFGGAMVNAGQVTTLVLVQFAEAWQILKHMQVVGPSQERDRRPTGVELQKLFAAFDARRSQIPMSDIVRFAICSAMRESEITRLQWDDLSVEIRMIKCRDRKHPTKKTGNHSEVPLLRGPVVIDGKTIDPLEIIQKQPKTSQYIFPYSAASVGEAFHDVVARLAIEDLHFHDLRHDGISRLFEAGLNIPEVALVSGHRNWKNLKRYTHIKPVTLHEKFTK